MQLSTHTPAPATTTATPPTPPADLVAALRARRYEPAQRPLEFADALLALAGACNVESAQVAAELRQHAEAGDSEAMAEDRDVVDFLDATAGQARLARTILLRWMRQMITYAAQDMRDQCLPRFALALETGDLGPLAELIETDGVPAPTLARIPA